MDFGKICLNCLNPTMYQGTCTCCGAKKNVKQPSFLALPAGTILKGRYLIGKTLGNGGFGITYLGLDLQSEKKVAIKEYMPVNVATRATGQIKVSVAKCYEDKFQYGVSRFYDEAKTLHTFSEHPNIVKVYKFFYENNTAYMVMEYLPGNDFRKYLRQKKTVSFSELLPIILPVMDALEYIHENNLIHRDISPDNIYMGDTVKLIDFGAARYAYAYQSNSLTIIMKEGYAPEEQYRSHGRQGPWTDIYALAATMYVSLTATMIPKAPDRLLGDQLIDIRKMLPGLPESAGEAIMKALALRAENRYQSVPFFRDALMGMERQNTFQPMQIRSYRLYGIQGFYSGKSLSADSDICIGRSAEYCSLIYPNNMPQISRVHCIIRIDRKRNMVIVQDCNSTYGTWVNGYRLAPGMEASLENGDFISLGTQQKFQIEF